ncbi:MAG: DUF4294 domain-containing protein [Daejeonella sp.]
MKYAPLATGANDTLRVAVTMIDDELMPWLPVPEVIITSTRIFRTPEEKAKFNRLRYNVLKVMPYAKFARNRYAQLQRDLALVGNKKDKKKLVKAFETEIKTMFTKEIKDLTINQGGILLKLIDRETGNTSYALLKEMKGSLTAFLYQSVARVFGNNLKSKYDPQEDRDIEAILQSSPDYMYN